MCFTVLSLYALGKAHENCMDWENETKNTYMCVCVCART